MSGWSARLDHNQLTSEAPERLAGFYQTAMGMIADRIGRLVQFYADTVGLPISRGMPQRPLELMRG